MHEPAVYSCISLQSSLRNSKCLSGPVASKIWCTSMSQQMQPSGFSSPALPWFPQESRAANPKCCDTPDCWVVTHLCLAAICPTQVLGNQYTPAGQAPLLTSPALSLQGCPRKPPPSFTSPHPEGHNLGFLLERGRCTATAQAEGGLKTAFSEMDVCQQHGLLLELLEDTPPSCYTVVQPGLQSGSIFIELLVQSSHPPSQGMHGLKFWVVSLGLPTCAASCQAPTVHPLPILFSLGSELVRRALSLG